MWNESILQPANENLRQALEILDHDGVVGIPTETVYGLAARLDRPKGLEKIFAVKQRPFFDPLIVHVESIAMAQKYVSSWNEICTVLAEAFWPGPLSLVLEKSMATPDIVTAGLTTVAVRMPKSGSTLELIRRAGVGLAAPSANRFGKSSPTTGAHVLSEFDNGVFVVDGSAAEIGIESTVLRVSEKGLTILRPGLVTASAIERVLRQKNILFSWFELSQRPTVESPGQLKHHYMPAVPLMLVGEFDSLPEIKAYLRAHADDIPNEIYGVAVARPQSFENAQELVLPGDPILAAREFYGGLRKSGESGSDFIFFRVRSTMSGEIWSAIFDRLTKAASLILPTAQIVQSAPSGYPS